MTISDEKLVAFLDDALPAEEAAEIGLALTRDAGLAARVEELAVDLDPLRAGMSELLNDAPALSVPTSREHGTPRRWLAAAAAAIFAMGVATGWALLPAEKPGWHQAVASYQVLYANQTVTAVPLDPAQRDAGLAAVSKALGIDLNVQNVSVEGLTFKRAQVLEWNGAPLAQLVYLDDQGRPIALCLHRSGSGADDRRAVRLSGMNGVTWRRGDMGFIAIGPVDEATIGRFADRLWDKVSL